jgi:hypothetical protein
MSILLLTVPVLLAGVVTYRLLSRLVQPVRVLVVCLLMVSLAAFILQSRELFALLVKSSDLLGVPTFSLQRAPGVPNPTDEPGSRAYFGFQSISQEDQNFLDEILQHQNRDDQKQGNRTRTQVQAVGEAGIIGCGNESVLKGELVINSAEGKHSEPSPHKETVKRAQLVAHNEMFKRAQLVRAKRP